jgi:hypothetical protein
MLTDVITDTWQPAEQIAKQSMLPFHSATKMLCSMAAEGKIESHEDEWMDERCRQRKRTLYRKKQDVGASMDVLMRAFGMVSAEMQTDADYLACRKSLNVRRHELR